MLSKGGSTMRQAARRFAVRQLYTDQDERCWCMDIPNMQESQALSLFCEFRKFRVILKAFISMHQRPALFNLRPSQMVKETGAPGWHE